jgi:hypothetical protein
MTAGHLCRALPSFFAVVLVAVAACSSSSGGAPGVPMTNAASCPNWTQPLDAYGGPAVEHEGDAGALRFVLTDITPAPPALGTLTWTLQLRDASGQPVKDATFTTIGTRMPQHTHGSTARPVPTNNGDGTYTIDNLYLYMQGVWQVTLEAKTPATTDETVFTLCLGT